jgi:hypothetical protein
MNTAPGLSIVPSGMVSLTKFATFLQLSGPADDVGTSVGTAMVGVVTAGVPGMGVSVESGSGVSVAGVDCVFCAWTVSATEVAMIELFLEAPQDVKVSVTRIARVGSKLNLNFIQLLS